VDKNLACSGSDFNTDNLIFYDGKIPYLEILKILRKYEEKQITEDVERLKNIEIALEEALSILVISPENTMSVLMPLRWILSRII